MAVDLSRGAVDEAVNCARSMMHASQQALPSSLEAHLGDAIREEEQGQAETARSHLSRAIELAQEMNYL
jgi:hypothetical protein